MPSPLRHAGWRTTAAGSGLAVVPTNVAAPNADMAKEDGVDFMELGISVQKVGPVLLRVMLEQSWAAKQQLVREHEDDLLDPIVFQTAMIFMAKIDEEGTMKPLLRYHWSLINHCIEVGIEAAFADVKMRQEFEALLATMNDR